MRSRLWLVLALVLVLSVVPRNAYADEARQVQGEELEQRELVLRAPIRTPMDAIRTWFGSVRVAFVGGSVYLDRLVNLPARLFISGSMERLFFVPAITIVFIWWGVRKVIRMLFRAFRRGKANV